MCIRCHQKIPDDKVIEMLKESFNNPQFEQWNNTSISHLCIASLGFNGLEARDLSNNLMKKYIEWKRLHPNKNDGTFFGNPTVQFVQSAYDDVNQLVDNSINESKEELLHKWTGSMPDGFDVKYTTYDKPQCIIL
jgi:hypothetical protein